MSGDEGARAGVPRMLLVAIVPAVIVVVFDVLLGAYAGRVSAFPSESAYRFAMNATALMRYVGLFSAVIFVWGLLRSWSAPKWLLAVAVLSGPVAYALVSFVRAQAFFPMGQAAYYGVNPIFVGALGAQAASAAVAESLWRWWRRRRGDDRGRPITWRIALIAVAGLAVLYGAVLWDGGIHWFYVYQQGYKALFARR